MKICLIITAAGMSTRQKRNKLLIRSCNETMIEKTIIRFINKSLDIFVIVGHQKDMLIPILNQRFGNDIQIVENSEYKTGIASSLKAGLNAAGKDYKYFGFCNGDKPFIKSSTIELMLEYLIENQSKILVPLFQEQNGHPTFFSKEFVDEFLHISGDLGGRNVINNHLEDVTFLPVDDEGVTMDLDKYLEND